MSPIFMHIKVKNGKDILNKNLNKICCIKLAKNIDIK